MTASGEVGNTSPLDPPGRVAVVGAGAFGRFSIDAYQATDDLHVVAVADPDPRALAQVHLKDGSLRSDWHAVVEDGQVEVVHLVTPPFLRGEIALAALGAGKSVFCEKPLALSLEEADAMIDRAGRSGVALGIDYVMRYQPAYRLLQRVASSGLTGAVRSISFANFAQMVPPDHWFWNRALSGGIFVEHGVHFFDAYAQVAGQAERVQGSKPNPRAVDATVWYAQGATAHFYHEFAFPSQVERASGTTMFEQGHIVVEGWIPTRISGALLAPAESVHALLREEGIDAAVHEDDAARFSAEFPDREGHYRTAVVDGMREVVRRHRDPTYRMTVSTEDARSSLRLALAAQEAAQDGSTVELLPVASHGSHSL